MRVVHEATLAERGRAGPVLRIALLPQVASTNGPPPLLCGYAGSENDLETLAEIQLLEGQEYLYEWTALPEVASAVQTEPREVFQPDTKDGLRGRLRPGLAAGAVNVQLNCGQIVLAQFDLEVRSRKLHYLSEYRWMLRDIAAQMTELVMERFAASGMVFSPSTLGDSVTLYQRFAFLRALITSEAFQSALNEIRRRPHVAWATRHEAVSPGQGLRAGSHAVRQLSRPGRREAWPDGPIRSIPEKVERKRTEATHDTTPNRFVRFAFERWRQVVADIDRGLARFTATPAIVRGRREVLSVLEFLDETLNQDLFKEAGALSHFPVDNQVLHRREGYRDVFKAYLEFELAAQLSWKGAESSYSAGQRDVAALYEYWVFFQLAGLVAELAGQSFDLRPLVASDRDGLNVVLRAGKETVLTGEVERYGRRLAVELCFNRTFGPDAHAGTWTRPMRPDYSLLIRPAETEPSTFEPIVVHFDAKYRVNVTAEVFGGEDELANTEEGVSNASELRRGGALRSDLLKMHAYRDAIRRSAGAYVIYPGNDNPASRANFREYHELLPGLGAFALRPDESGVASGRGPLQRFLEDVFQHVATRLTRHERGRYWLEEVYGRYNVARSGAASTAPDEPLSATNVMLGYVKSAEHWRWIRDRRTYNVRTEGRVGGVPSTAALLYCQLLLLYCPELDAVALARVVSGPERIERHAMEQTGYPAPTSDYWCIQFSWLPTPASIAELAAASVGAMVDRAEKRKGEPAATTWGELRSLVSSADNL